MTLTAATNWPTGTFPYYLVIDPGLSNEEKILATARSGASLTGLTRGVDGTSAATHTAGAEVHHIFTAVEADEANNAAKSTLGTVTTKGDLLVASASQALARLGVGTTGLPLVANSVATNGLNYAALTSTGLGTDSVITAKIAAGAVTGNELATDSVGVNKLVDGSVTTPKIAANAVDGTKIAVGAVDTTQLAASAVTTGKLADNSVTSAKIVAGTIVATDLSSTIFGAGSSTSTPANDTIGTMTCAHGCAFTPGTVVATVHSAVGPGTALVCSGVDNIGATTFDAHIFNVATGAYYHFQPVTLFFICLP